MLGTGYRDASFSTNKTIGTWAQGIVNGVVVGRQGGGSLSVSKERWWSGLFVEVTLEVHP